MPMPRTADWVVAGPTGPCVMMAGNVTFSLNYKTADGYVRKRYVQTERFKQRCFTCISMTFTNEYVDSDGKDADPKVGYSHRKLYRVP
jgi:hypothetical protein